MLDLKTFRQEWSSDQKRLREMLKTGVELDQAFDLFFSQHAVLHSQKMSNQIDWSYADEIFSEVEDDQYRIIPDNGDHSLMWILWHISQIEDVTMNVLIAGGSQIFM